MRFGSPSKIAPHQTIEKTQAPAYVLKTVFVPLAAGVAAVDSDLFALHAADDGSCL